MKIQMVKPFIKRQNQKLDQIKDMENKFDIPSVVQAFPYVENNALNLVL